MENKSNNPLQRNPIDLTYNGKCSRCSGCCSSIIPLTSQETARLKQYAFLTGYQPVIPDGDTIVYMKCPFLKSPTNVLERYSCSIYDIRPSICRSFLCCCDNMQNMEAYAAENKSGETALSVNLWHLFGKTGLRINGQDITPENAGSIVLTSETGEKHTVKIGSPVAPVLRSGPLGVVLCLGLTKTGMQIFDGEEKNMRFILYDEIVDLSPDVVI